MTSKKIVKKIRRRRRRKSSNPTRLYFHKGTQNAIILYQNLNTDSIKEDLYVREILPAFSKLVENLIFIHGFARVHDSFEALKNDCVAFLYETIHKWDPTRGTKAFSYFNVVAKNWLIIKSKQKTKRNRRHVSIDDRDSLALIDLEMIENYDTVASPDDDMIQLERTENITKLLYEIKGRLSNDNELSCINAIITIFENVDNLDFLNKRALFVYMRDLSSLNPKQLSIAMSTIRKHYRELSGTDDFEIF